MDDFSKVIIPDAPEFNVRGCPKCGDLNYDARMAMGVLTKRCVVPTCRNVWQGGLPQEPMDPTKPRPPENPNDLPLVESVDVPRSSEHPDGRMEVRRRPNYTQDFRKGAPAPKEE